MLYVLSKGLSGPQSCDGIIVILSYVHTSSITHASPSLLESVQGGNMRIFTFKQRCLFVSTMRCLIKQCFLQELFQLEAESSRVWGKSRSLVLVSVWVIIWSRSGENRILYKTLGSLQYHSYSAPRLQSTELENYRRYFHWIVVYFDKMRMVMLVGNIHIYGGTILWCNGQGRTLRTDAALYPKWTVLYKL